MVSFWFDPFLKINTRAKNQSNKHKSFFRSFKSIISWLITCECYSFWLNCDRFTNNETHVKKSLILFLAALLLKTWQATSNNTMESNFVHCLSFISIWKMLKSQSHRFLYYYIYEHFVQWSVNYSSFFILF